VRRTALVVGALALLGPLTACGKGSGASALPAPAVSAPAGAAPSASPAPSDAPTLRPSAIADPGLPSTLGDGKLTDGQIKQLAQYFEDKVAAAYAAGDADALAHYLAGMQLIGNRATIEKLNSLHRRNVYSITIRKVDVSTNAGGHLIFDITAEETRNYFVDSTAATPTPLNNGLPGARAVDETIFLDFNPGNRTWYWTGEKAQQAGTGTDG
jgi:hypothetical protein